MNRILSLIGATSLALAAHLGAVPSAAAEPVSLRWIDQPRGELDAVIDDLFVKSFNESHPDIQLEIRRQEEHEKFVRMLIEANNAPDIIQLNGPSEVVDLAEAGKIVPLDAYAEKYGWKDKLQSWAFDSGMVAGKLYAVPLTYETMLLYFNKDALAKLGLELPKTLADVEAACRKATEAGIVCFANTTGGKASRGEWWIGWHLNAGAGPRAVYDVLKGQAPWSSLGPQLTRNIEWIKSGWYGGRQDIYFALSFDEAWAMLSSGGALMRVAGSWDLQRMKKFCDVQCDWVAAPSLSPEVAEHFELAIGETLSISADSENPDQAAEVLDHLFNDRARSAKIIEASNFSAWMVPLQWQKSDFSADADPRFVRLTTDFADLTSKGQFGYTTWTFLPPKTRSYLFETLEAVLVESTTADEYVNGIQAVFDAESKDVPPLPEPKM